VGMEDTVWRYPHSNDKLESNVQAFTSMKTIVENLGLTVASYDRYSSVMGL